MPSGIDVHVDNRVMRPSVSVLKEGGYSAHEGVLDG
jgi:hypothetical protein